MNVGSLVTDKWIQTRALFFASRVFGSEGLNFFSFSFFLFLIKILEWFRFTENARRYYKELSYTPNPVSPMNVLHQHATLVTMSESDWHILINWSPYFIQTALVFALMSFPVSASHPVLMVFNTPASFGPSGLWQAPRLPVFLMTSAVRRAG